MAGAIKYRRLSLISQFAQVLAKSCKMVPVMIMGTLVGGKRYSMVEYVCVGLIAGGVSLFASQARLASQVYPFAYLVDGRLTNWVDHHLFDPANTLSLFIL